MADEVNATPAPKEPPPTPADSVGLAPRAVTVPARSMIVRDALQGLVPTSIGEAVEISTILAKSSAIPRAFRGKPETVFTVIMAGLELGLTPLRALQNLQSIHGNLGMKADLQLALVRKSGLLEYFDEGYEERGLTDKDLGDRTKDGDRILSLVQTVPEGKPYGWSTMQRKGEQFLITKVFSWKDADRAFTYEKDEDAEPSAKSEKKKLSDKFNFQSWPQDMYPKRARVRTIQMAFPDVTAGIPAVEHLEDRAVVEGEILTGDEDTPDADQLLYDIEQVDADLAKRIAGGFEQLKIAGAKKLTKLVEYRGKPQDLLKWLQDEYARRQGKHMKQPDVLADRKEPTTPAPTEATKPVSRPAPPPKQPKPWGTVHNGSERASWVEVLGERIILEAGDTIDVVAEPDGVGRGIVFVEEDPKPDPKPEPPKPNGKKKTLKDMADSLKTI